MKTFTVEALQDEPIILVTVTPEYSILRDMPISRVDAKELIDAADRKVFYILDLSELSISFEELISAANFGARGDKTGLEAKDDDDDEALWHHPNIERNVIVSKSALLKLAAKGLNSNAFGNLNVEVCGTIEEAFDYCRTYSSGGAGFG